jgi:hypothetical protein
MDPQMHWGRNIEKERSLTAVLLLQLAQFRLVTGMLARPMTNDDRNVTKWRRGMQAEAAFFNSVISLIGRNVGYPIPSIPLAKVHPVTRKIWVAANTLCGRGPVDVDDFNDLYAEAHWASPEITETMPAGHFNWANWWDYECQLKDYCDSCSDLWQSFLYLHHKTHLHDVQTPPMYFYWEEMNRAALHLPHDGWNVQVHSLFAVFPNEQPAYNAEAAGYTSLWTVACSTVGLPPQPVPDDPSDFSEPPIENQDEEEYVPSSPGGLTPAPEDPPSAAARRRHEQMAQQVPGPLNSPPRYSAAKTDRLLAITARLDSHVAALHAVDAVRRYVLQDAPSHRWTTRPVDTPEDAAPTIRYLFTLVRQMQTALEKEVQAARAE